MHIVEEPPVDVEDDMKKMEKLEKEKAMPTMYLDHEEETIFLH